MELKKRITTKLTLFKRMVSLYSTCSPKLPARSSYNLGKFKEKLRPPSPHFNDGKNGALWV